MSRINRLHPIYQLQYMVLKETTCCNIKLADCSGCSGKWKKSHQYIFVLCLFVHHYLIISRKCYNSHFTVHKCIQVTQNTAKANNLTPFGALGFKRK